MAAFRVERIEHGSVTSPKGFRAAGAHGGLKQDGALDLALVYSEARCVGAAVFTTNAFKAAPVLYDQALIASRARELHGAAINSGCANACTGEQGMRDAEAMAKCAEQALSAPAETFVVMSTGVIGMAMPMNKITHGIDLAADDLSADVEGGHRAARAIMTTDTRPKESAVCVSDDESSFVIAGMAKGSGMIHPNMATMLSVVTTDVSITPELAQAALVEAVEVSFNMITVDGDTSTNDTLLLLANGQADGEVITKVDQPEYAAFVAGLREVTQSLAQGIIRDGEGATRFIEIKVQGARTVAEAKQVAKAIAHSPLVKTAIYGQDANWGRIICAVGYSGVSIEPTKVGVWLDDLELVRKGAPYDLDEERASVILARNDIPIRVDLGLASSEAVVWTCDLSHKYVDINAHYRT